MKRFLTAALAVLLVFAFCACAKTEEVIVQDGMKLAGVQAASPTPRNGRSSVTTAL